MTVNDDPGRDLTHCDDAVFGCGSLLARHPGSVVVPVFAGRPQTYDAVTPWDEAAGFGDGDDSSRPATPRIAPRSRFSR